MNKSMFVVLSFTATFLFASVTFAEDLQAPACGAPGVKFEVKTEKRHHPAQPEAGKALVYFIQDDSEYLWRPRPTTRLGMDGEWVGATHTNSYFYFFVAPGVHHLCASWQSTEVDLATAAAHFTTEAGGTYYFGVKDRIGLSFNPLDSDEGELLVNRFTLSISHAKK